MYRGPYKDQAPDLIVGYASGYRVSWDAAVGRTSRDVFHDNTKAWSGDHCVDPSVVPGVLFCNRKIESTQPRLLDIAPTVLDLFGIPDPGLHGRPRAGDCRARRPATITRFKSTTTLRRWRDDGIRLRPLWKRRSFLKGAAAAAAVGAPGVAAGSYWLGRRQSRLAKPWQEGHRDRHRRHGSPVVHEHDAGRPAAEPGED